MPIYALGDRTPTIHPDAFVHPDAVIIGDVRIGAESSIWPGAVLRGDYGTIIVGERTSIHDRALIGNGSIVLHEAVIHRGATVAAGAVVRNNMEVPANAAAMGVPATIRLDFSNEEEIVVMASTYVANTLRYKKELRLL